MPHPSRTPQKSFSKGHRSSPYGSASRNKPAGGTFGASFNPNLENLDTPGQYESPDIERARRDPLHHYTIRSGFHRGKTLAEVRVEDDSYMGWMRGKHYNTLSHDHIPRKAIDQWDAESKSTDTWTVPALSTAPARFRQANPKFYLYMQERCLKKLWKVTPAELEAAGAKFTQNMAGKTKPKKFALFHVYEYVKGPGGMSKREADEALETETARINKSKENYKRYQSGEYAGGGYDDDMMDYPF